MTSRTILRAAGDAILVLRQESEHMNSIKLVAVAFIVAGVLGLIYGGFSYTKDTTVVKLGPLELTAKEKQTVNVLCGPVLVPS